MAIFTADMQEVNFYKMSEKAPRNETSFEKLSNTIKTRRRIVLSIAVMLLVVYTLVHFIEMHRDITYTVGYNVHVRKANRFYENPYGEEGEQRLPQAIVIGVRKAGTRAMLNYLKLHPDVRVTNAECHFFAYTDNYNQGLEFYRKQMPYSKSHQITMEKTPNYFHNGDVSAERIKAMNSSIKLIIVVREPVARTVSSYMQFYQNKGDTRTLEELTLTKYGKVNSKAKPVQNSNYYNILQKFWLTHFPKEQIHIVDGDALGKGNPGHEMKLVQQFLGIRPVIDENSFVFDKEKQFYCMKKTGHIKCLGGSKGRPHPPQDATLLKKLKQYYEPYNTKLFNFVGRDFGWNS